MHAVIRLFVTALSLLALISSIRAQSGNDFVQFKMVPIEGSRPDGTELAWVATHGPSAKFIHFD